MQIHKHRFALKTLGSGNSDGSAAVSSGEGGYAVSCTLNYPTPPSPHAAYAGGKKEGEEPECVVKGPLGELSLYLSNLQKTSLPRENAWFFLALTGAEGSQSSHSIEREQNLPKKSPISFPKPLSKQQKLDSSTAPSQNKGMAEPDSLHFVMILPPKKQQKQSRSSQTLLSQSNDKFSARFKTLKKHLQTAFVGVTSGFLSQLEIRGLGYRAWKDPSLPPHQGFGGVGDSPIGQSASVGGMGWVSPRQKAPAVVSRGRTSSSGHMRFKLGETHEHRVRMKPDLVYKTASGSQKKQTVGGGVSGGTEGGGQPLLMYGINKSQVFQTSASLIQLSLSPASRGDVYKGKGVRRTGGRGSSMAKLKSGKRK